MTSSTHIQAAPTADRGALLRYALRGNGLFSLLSGLAFAFASGPISERIGLAWPLALLIVGIGLIGYSALLFYGAGRPGWLRGIGWLAVEGDIAWVVGSVVVLLTGWLGLNAFGNWMVVILADVVALFAIVQYVGVRRLQAE